MPSSIPGSDTESEGASVAPRPSPPLGEARAKPALESGPAHPLAPTLRAVGRFARRKPLGALGALAWRVGASPSSPSGVPVLAARPARPRALPTGGVAPPLLGREPRRRGRGGAAGGRPGPPAGAAAAAPGGGPARIPPRHILP